MPKDNKVSDHRAQAKEAASLLQVLDQALTDLENLIESSITDPAAKARAHKIISVCKAVIESLLAILAIVLPIILLFA